MKNTPCYCGNVSPEIRQETRIISIEGKEYPLVEQYSYCTKCNRDWVTPEQLQDSLNKVTSIKRRAQGFLAPEDIKALRERHGLTQKQAAAIFGGGENAFSKYERGEVYPTAAMDKLMRLFDALPETRNFLRKEAGILKAQIVEDNIAATEDKTLGHGKIIRFPININERESFEVVYG